MAVQAALLSPHPFVPFGFAGAPDGLGGAFGALDKGCCFEDDETGAPAGAQLAGAEGGDVREATRDLLSFIDSASSNIKLALDKPGKSKRKVNHRKYLQKQIKRCSGLMGAAPPGPPSPGAADTPAKRPPAAPSAPTVAAPAHGKAAPRREASQAAAAASLQSRSLAALFDSLRQVPVGDEPAGGAVTAPAAGICGTGAGGTGGDAAGPTGGAVAPGARKVPLRARNLPPSFFTEPSRAGGGGCGPSGPGVSLGDLEKGAEAVEFFELLGPDYGAGTEAGVLLAAEPLDVFPAGVAALRGPPELEPGLFEPPPAMVGNLLYPEPWSAPGPPTKKTPLAAARGGLTLNEPLRPLYPAAADSPGGEDVPGHLASFAPFFPDCALPPPPPPQVSYDYSAGYSRTAYSSLWRPDGVWEEVPGEEGAHRD
ncbi:protein FAM181B [Elephas maximus indicus]|uniref:protein FAM181B n=1 Tax=Elephas maximus indicus TaxID=99487 RepID=UPI002115F9EC|nr:protein FAM181B [Elephas maximus indicus]